MRQGQLTTKTIKFLSSSEYTIKQKQLMMDASKKVRCFVGTIEIPGIARGAACLLQNGQIITCLHNILDYSVLHQGKAELLDFSTNKISVYFVKDGNIFSYKIKHSPVNGLKHLKHYGANSWCFDYAFLDVEGNPVNDIGGGFKLDKTDHFGTAALTDPQKTLAISGPFIHEMEDGRLRCYRYISLSENQAAHSAFYNITQEGNHPTAPGFSGIGITPFNEGYASDTLYAMHSYRDQKLQQTGAKVSEILSSVRNSVIPNADARIDPWVINNLQNWYERYTIAIIRKATGQVTRSREVSFQEALVLLQKTRVDIYSDTLKEARTLGALWDLNGPLIEHGREKNKPFSRVHLHHSGHDTNSTAYPNHLFYVDAQEHRETRVVEQAVENKARQLAAKQERDQQKGKSAGR
jgi:hypothetical protein